MLIKWAQAVRSIWKHIVRTIVLASWYTGIIKPIQTQIVGWQEWDKAVCYYPISLHSTSSLRSHCHNVFMGIEQSSLCSRGWLEASLTFCVRSCSTFFFFPWGFVVTVMPFFGYLILLIRRNSRSVPGRKTRYGSSKVIQKYLAVQCWMQWSLNQN